MVSPRSPDVVDPMATGVAGDVKPLDDRETQVAFAQMVEMWTDQSNGDLK